jgi:hypothetical protein
MHRETVRKCIAGEDTVMVLCVLGVQNGSFPVMAVSMDKDMLSFLRNAIQKLVCIEWMILLSCFIVRYFVQVQERNFARYGIFADFFSSNFSVSLFFVAFRADGWPKADTFVVLSLTGVRNFYYFRASLVCNGAESVRKLLYMSYIHIDITHSCLCIKIRK